jgi:hypothetical protein
MINRLRESDLTAKDAVLLKLKPLLAVTVASKYSGLPVHRAGFVIPYFTVNGKPTEFYRFRYLEYGHEKGIAKLTATTAKKLFRYGQAAGTTNELYLPPFINWSAYSQDVTKPLLITEGELKSACATRHGLPTVGLGGVWCFKGTAQRQPLLTGFNLFKWKDRVVYIIYDSDAATNPQVIKAENALARELLLLGSVPHVCRVPHCTSGKKTGLDDYIVEKGVDTLMKRVIKPTEPWIAARELHALNEEVVYVTDPGLILRLDTCQRLTARAFVDHAYSTRVYYEEKPTKDGGVQLTEKSAPREWLKWTPRATVNKITYEPGAAQRTESGCLNTWPGWAAEPIRGEVQRWHALLDYLFYGTPATEREWFEQWLAYPLQNPGVKLYTACVLWGVHHGTGKSLIGYTMFKIYGVNATEISDRDLFSTHNEWAEYKQFVMGDEITGGDKRATADRMKSMITQRLLRVNPKYVPSYTVPDCVNYYFTSNHPDAFFLEDTDRRFFIHEVHGRPQSDGFYKDYVEWLEAGGAARLFYYFLNMDLSKFNPQGHAPVTASKTEMIDSGRSDLAYWVHKLRDDPDRALVVGGHPCSYRLFSSEDLRLIYDPLGTTKVTTNGLARELKRSGFSRVYNGNPVLTQSAGGQRLWAIRDVEHTVGLNSGQLIKLYDTERRGPTGSKNGTGKKSKF